MNKVYIEAEKMNELNQMECFVVGKNNKIATNYDKYQFFESEFAAGNWINSEDAKNWTDCTFRIVSEEHI